MEVLASGRAIRFSTTAGALAVSDLGEQNSQKQLRREFLERLGLAVTASGVAGPAELVRLALGDEGDSGPIDCGPPPPAVPQHQTGGESFPPLPLPGHAAAAEREEAAAQPAGADGQGRAWATIRWTTRDGRRVQYRDWMTDPADVITLLRWTAREAGDQLSRGRGRFRPFLLRSAGAAGPAAGRAQQVRAERRGPRSGWPAT